ncbi:hypothetical protein I3760_04G057800 [Carya illinoinensis]|nr:hypothetical protein I3760_04G057800 [Carya illinoinensis]
MDYAGWPETHRITPQPRPPNTNPPPPDPYSSSHYPYYPPDHIPVSLTAVTHSSLGPHDLYAGLGADPGRIIPIGVDAYASLSSYQHTHLRIQGHAGAGSYGHRHLTPGTGSSVYYSDPNSQNWAAKEAVRIYGAYRVGYGAGVPIPSSGTEQLAIANSNFTFRANSTPRHGNSAGKMYRKKMKTKTKTVQSVYCELCNIDCDTKDVLDKHKLGKKHKKNLEKLNEVTAPAQSAEGSKNLVIGPQEKPNMDKAVGGKKSRKKAAAHEEDLESKRRKVLEGGAAAEAVRTCAICNVVCNSETVFNYHLAGQKHAAMVKKQADGTGMATAS